MSGLFSIGGLSSGLDTSAMITKLMAIESQPTVKMNWKQQLWETRKSTWSDLNTRLNTLRTNADTLTNPSTWTKVASSASSDTSKITTSVNSQSPASGTYAFAISQLATTEAHTAANTLVGGALADDTFTITQGVNVWDIPVTTGDDETTIAGNINAIAGSGVNATVVGGKLKITALASGAANDFTTSSLLTLDTDLGMATTTTGVDAAFTVNGNPYTRAQNANLTDVIAGVNINLLNTTASNVTLTVAAAGPASTDDIKSSIEDFVAQYNSVIDFVNTKESEQRVTSPKSLDDYLSGPVSHDYQWSTIGYDLRRWATDVVQGLPNGSSMLSDIGISTGAYSSTYDPNNTSGKLVIDDAKLTAALNADASKVQAIFQQVGTGLSTDGVGRRLSVLIGQWRTGGTVDMALQDASSQITSLQDSIDSFQYRLEQRRSYYENMFARLESTLAKLQSQGSWLSSQLASLSSSSSGG